MEDLQNERNVILTGIKKIEDDIASFKRLIKDKSAAWTKLHHKLKTLNINIFKTKYGVSYRLVCKEYMELVEPNVLKWPYDKEAMGHPILIPNNEKRQRGGLTYMIKPEKYNKCIPNQKTWDAFGVFGYPIILSTKAMIFDDVGDFDKLQEVLDLSDTSIISK